jgi:putative transposase
MRVCAYVLMPNHFHLVLWPRRDGQLSGFMRWLTMTHTQRWHAHRHSAGGGHLYQGRFKSFPIELDDHFLRVCRYVERNPLRADLAPRSADWPWGSLACRTSRPAAAAAADLLDDWPVDRPATWRRTVDRPQSQPELDALHHREPGQPRHPGRRYPSVVIPIRAHVTGVLRDVPFAAHVKPPGAGDVTQQRLDRHGSVASAAVSASGLAVP